MSFATRDGTRLRAWLFVPAQAPGRPAGGPSSRLATVVALHGCSGVAGPHAPPGTTFSPRHLAMAEMLLGEGYAVLFPDSLGPRGTGSICSQKIGVRAVNQAQRRLDALAALSWVAAQPWADPHRIAVLGWSHGANTVLAVTNTKRPEVNAVPDRFAAAIAFYPWCRAAVQTGYRPNTHLAIMIGALDDWTPAQPCVSLGRITQSEVHVFGGTYHDFDNLAGRLRHIPNIPNGVDPAQGVHAGPNPDARDEAYSRVRRLLATALR
ncbi:MAG: prolyl oligopeptidase family serine peptidase [Xylophilus ampelinus]